MYVQKRNETGGAKDGQEEPVEITRLLLARIAVLNCNMSAEQVAMGLPE